VKKLIFKFSILLVCISSLNAAQWSYSLGLSDMLVKGAKPLSSAPNGDDSHTLGIQFGIYGQSDKDSKIQQSGYFKTIIDKDRDHLDPDHIPIWFLANYQAKMPFKTYESITLNAIFDADAKTNTVSSVEREFKFYAGGSAEYANSFFKTELKALLGRFALEIDDDVPKFKGFHRDALKEVSYGYSLAADARFSLSKNFGLTLGAQTWQSSGEMLENQYSLAVDYNSNSWIEKSKFIFSFVATQYNLDEYNQGAIHMLPWDEDYLFQAYMIIPF